MSDWLKRDGRWEWLLLAICVAAGLFFRLYRLDSAPPGMTHDEADIGYFMKAVYLGQPAAIDTPYGYANEPFSMYSGAVFMRLFGPTELAMRLHSVFFGLLMLVFLFLWARRAFGRWVALGAAALLAVSYWPVSTARLAVNWQPAPALFAASTWFLWLAWFDARRPARWWTWLGFALCLGASVWTYEVARATLLVMVAFAVFLLVADRERARQRGLALAGALALGLALAAPHLLDPAAWQRSSTLSVNLRALLAGDPNPMLTAVLETLGAFFIQGDPFITYNLPGRPVFDPVMGALFSAGLLVCLWRWRRPENALLLLWLAIGMGPVMVVGVWNFVSHGMGMQPIVFVPPALAAVEVGRLAGSRWGRRGAVAVGILFAGLVLLVAAGTYWDYFQRWSQWPEVGDAYFHDLATAAEYLDEEAPAGTVVLSSPFPDLPHDPFIVDLQVQRTDLALRWADGRGALVYPAGTEEAHLLVLADALLARPLVPLGAEPVRQTSSYAVFQWDPDGNWESLCAPGHTAAYFGAAELAGYAFPITIRVGEVMEVMSCWQVLDPAALGPVPASGYGTSAAIFVQLLDPGGGVAAQQDRLDAPAWNWTAGDRFVQLHQLVLPVELEPGRYPLIVGLYTRPDMTRLPLAGGGDYWVLGSVEVGP